MIAIAIRGVWKVERREEEARHAATHDQLTGLPNRATLMCELDAALADDPPRDTIAVLYVDLDGFKAVNDNYGHDTGDRVIKEIAVRFAAHCRDARLARLAGDEFAAFLSGQDVRKRAVEIGFALRREVEKPFDADGRITLRGASIGVSVSDADAKTAEELLRRADVAMYQAKQKQRGTLSVYDAAVDREMRERAWLAQQLRLAIREHRLEVVYQPVFNALTMEPVVVEALVRWTPGGLAPVPPMVFVSLAEEAGLIDDLGAWILRRACEDARAWPDLRVAVNISPVQLRNPRFGAVVAGVLADTGMPAERLEVELTEGYLIEQPIQASETIDGLRAMGISIALDDFGTGYSSIGYLRQFRFDKLKLDSSMIDGIETATDVQRLVQATVALADALGLRVTAEGVQSDAAVVILRAAGCHELQGFHLGKPCPVEELWTLVGKPDADLRQGAA